MTKPHTLWTKEVKQNLLRAQEQGEMTRWWATHYRNTMETDTRKKNYGENEDRGNGDVKTILQNW